MPLTEKGQEIKKSMEQEYGAKKGEQVFYASKNAGKITGVDSIERPEPYATPRPTPQETPRPQVDSIKEYSRDVNAHMSAGMKSVPEYRGPTKR